LIRLGGLCVPHLCTHSWKITNTQKCITCINIFIPKPFLTHYWAKYWLFSFKYPYIYALDVFSCLFNTCTREWSKLVIRTTKGENSYHLCFWHQWPFGASRSWFQIFITISKLIQSIIYRKHQIGLHMKYFKKIPSKKNSHKIDSFCVLIKNPLCDILHIFSLCIHFHIKTQLIVNLIRFLNSTWLG
jgi:hypothetical protein